jgi:hypothetical protein
MNTRDYKSDESNDHIRAMYFSKSHKTNLYIETFDQLVENIKLIDVMVNELKNENIKWICVKVIGDPIIPENTVWFCNKKNKKISCHIEDFKKFYFKNISSMIKPSMMCVEIPVCEDGWSVVVDKKKLKRNKFNDIKKNIEHLTSTSGSTSH